MKHSMRPKKQSWERKDERSYAMRPQRGTMNYLASTTTTDTLRLVLVNVLVVIWRGLGVHHACTTGVMNILYRNATNG